MPRPKNKQALIEQNNKTFINLMTYLDLLTKEQISAEFKPGTLNRNIRDVIAHLHHWHLMMYTWYKEGMEGQQPKMPAIGHTWRTLPKLNQEINKQYQDFSYKRAITAFKKSHQEIMTIIINHNDEELFTKKKYKWTGSTSLAEYLISNTCSHYVWALKLIKRTTS